MFKGGKVSLVIPCHNEEEGLALVLKRKPSVIDEVIVIDNDSCDNTSPVAKENGADVVFVREKGYGAAYLAGLPRATGEYIIIMDGDDSYPIDEAEKLLECLSEKGADLVSGCRFPLSDKRAMPRYKQISNSLISFFIRKMFRIDLADSQSGMLVFRKGLIDEINPSNRGMGFSQEIKILSWTRPGLKCIEEHISYRQRAGKIKFRSVRDGLGNLYDCILLRGRRSK
ncbi:MAG: glycosyltransferase family 2 protein [Candidatus Omnitrophota bacterium]